MDFYVGFKILRLNHFQSHAVYTGVQFCRELQILICHFPFDLFITAKSHSKILFWKKTSTLFYIWKQLMKWKAMHSRSFAGGTDLILFYEESVKCNLY